MVHSAAMAAAQGVPWLCMSTARPHTTLAGLDVANRRAAAMIFSLGTHVMASTWSSDSSRARSASSSKP